MSTLKVDVNAECVELITSDASSLPNTVLSPELDGRFEGVPYVGLMGEGASVAPRRARWSQAAKVSGHRAHHNLERTTCALDLSSLGGRRLEH